MLTAILVASVLLGGAYALMAMGLTLQYGVARIMNLATSETLMGAAFGSFWLFTAMQLSPLLSLLVIVPLAFAINWAIYRWLLTPLVRRAKNQGMLEVDSILATFGLLFVIEGAMLAGFGATDTVNPEIPSCPATRTICEYSSLPSLSIMRSRYSRAPASSTRSKYS